MTNEDLVRLLRYPLRSEIEGRAEMLDTASAEQSMCDAADAIERLQASKRGALKIADERAIEANGVRQQNERLLIALANIADGATKSAATAGLGAPIVALLERIATIARGAVEQTAREQEK